MEGNQQINELLNENDYNLILNLLAQQEPIQQEPLVQQQAPEIPQEIYPVPQLLPAGIEVLPYVYPAPPSLNMSINEFLDRFVNDIIHSLEHILVMYEAELDPIPVYYSRAGWYANLDEQFDHVCRAVRGYHSEWRKYPEMAGVLERIFMVPHRMGRHISKEQAREMLDALINFRDMNQ
jgi:hypothetical protein